MSSGLIPDGEHFVQTARDEAKSSHQVYKCPILTSDLAARMGGYLHAYTLYSSVRPFGISAIIAAFDAEDEVPVDAQQGGGPGTGGGGRVAGKKYGGPALYMIEPNGSYWGYYGAATGKGRQTAKAELEKLNLHEGNLTLLQGVKEAARIIYAAHDDNKDKEFELEMTWISGKTGPTKGVHQVVPKELVEEAERLAKESDDDDDDETDPKDKMED